VLTAQEAPELIHGVDYDYPGDYELAARLIAGGKADGRQCVLANDVHYPLDYGTVMPMVCYLDRAQRLPMVPISVCLSADLDEAFAWGRILARCRARRASASDSWRAAASRTSWFVTRRVGPFRTTRRSIIGSRSFLVAATTRLSGDGCPSFRAWLNPKWAAGTLP
jgi:hypothetical protein